MMAVCAYCGPTDAKITGEHLFPAWAYRTVPQWTMKYLGRIDKLVGPDPVINDVCETCNSGLLSKLDSYAKTLWEKFFSNIVPQNASITFEYDYDQLARWLLKIAYNDARVSRTEDHDALASLARYILGEDFRPTGLLVGLRLLIPHKLTDTEVGKLDENQRRILVDGGIPPSLVRIDAINPSDAGGELSVIRCISINSYQFFILVPQGYYAKLLRRANYMEKEVRIGKDIMILLPDKSSVAVAASTVTSLDIMGEFVGTHPDLAKSVPKRKSKRK